MQWVALRAITKQRHKANDRGSMEDVTTPELHFSKEIPPKARGRRFTYQWKRLTEVGHFFWVRQEDSNSALTAGRHFARRKAEPRPKFELRRDDDWPEFRKVVRVR